jgi:uncharacterized protein YkwD
MQKNVCQHLLVGGALLFFGILDAKSGRQHARLERQASSVATRTTAKNRQDEFSKSARDTRSAAPSNPNGTPKRVAQKSSMASVMLKQEAKAPSREVLLEKKIHVLINRERTQRGLVPLVWHDLLADAARSHSHDMAKRDYFEHKSPEGHDFMWRYAQVGFNGVIIVERGNVVETHYGSENIFLGWVVPDTEKLEAEVLAGYNKKYSGASAGTIAGDGSYTLDEMAKITVDCWMKSKGHRTNLLQPHWRRAGVGVAIAPDGKILATQNFC